MTALLALLALLAGPVLVLVPAERLRRRARAAGVQSGDREAGKALVRPAEAYAVVTGLVLIVAALLLLAVLAVLQ